MPITVLHITTSLRDGGAEGLLTRLVSNSSQVRHVVISLLSGGKYYSILKANGVPVHSIYFDKPHQIIPAFFKLISFIRFYNPSILHSWMYYGDLLTSIAAIFFPKTRVIWCVRHSNLDPATDSVFLRLSVLTLSALSRVSPAKIVYCSTLSQRVHEEYGYNDALGVVIHNGFNVSSFYRPVFTARSLRLKPASLLNVSRYHPQKDHKSLFKALSMIDRQVTPFTITLVGTGMHPNNSRLMNLIKHYSLEEVVYLLGPRNDMFEIYTKAHFLVSSSSHGESFPNVIAEAMLCGTPCIVTESGASQEIVDSLGWTSPTNDPASLFMNISQALSMNLDDYNRLSKECSLSIEKRYNLSGMIEAYESLYATTSLI